MDKSKIIKQVIKNELKQINDLALSLSIKYDNELANLTEKYNNEQDIHLKSFYKTSINYISLEIDKLDNMELAGYLIEDVIFVAIKKLLDEEIITLDDWNDGQNTYGSLELTGNQIVKHLLMGFKLISLFENDPYLIKNKKHNTREKDTTIKNSLQKASEKTSNFITKNLLEDEVKKLDEYSSINKTLLLESVFYHIAKDLILFKKYNNDKVERITNNIIKEVYQIKRFKIKITGNEQSIKYNNYSFGIYK